MTLGNAPTQSVHSTPATLAASSHRTQSWYCPTFLTFKGSNNTFILPGFIYRTFYRTCPLCFHSPYCPASRCFRGRWTTFIRNGNVRFSICSQFANCELNRTVCKVGFDPTPPVFQTGASTKLASSTLMIQARESNSALLFTKRGLRHKACKE